MQHIILTHPEIEHKTKRIAYQIYETFANDSELVIAGISNSGFTFAQKIAQQLETISNIKITICEVNINKQNPSFCVLFLGELISINKTHQNL